MKPATWFTTTRWFQSLSTVGARQLLKKTSLLFSRHLSTGVSQRSCLSPRKGVRHAERKAEKLVCRPGLYDRDLQTFGMDYPKPVCQKPRCDLIIRQQMQAATQQKGMLDLELFVCMHCGKDAGLAKCSRCRLAAYCSKECQQQHWPQHKSACKHLASGV